MGRRPARKALFFLYLVTFATGVVLLAPFSVKAAGTTLTRNLIAPPAGWSRENLTGSRSSALGLVLAQWIMYDRGREEYIEIGRRSSYGFTSDSFERFHRAILTRMGDRIYVYRRQQLCGGEQGWFVKHRSTAYPNAYMDEDVYLADGSSVYFASYHYPSSLPPSKSAQHAIASLCIPSLVVAKAPVLPVSFTAPPGWLISDPKHVGAPQRPGVLAYFLNPNHPNDLLMIVHDRSEGEVPSASDRAAEKTVQALMKRENIKETILSSQTYGVLELCGQHTGLLFKYTVMYGRTRLAYQQMMLFGPKLYSAVYVHPASKPAFKPAIESLSTICPIGSTATEIRPAQSGYRSSP